MATTEEMEPRAPKSTVFDVDYYGVALRTARQKKGYSRAEDFCDDVSTWTGVKVNKEALYRIEKGVQPPTVEQLIAFTLVLNRGRGIGYALERMELERCLTPYTEYLARQSAPLNRVATYDGYYCDKDNGIINNIYPDEEPASYIDEFYYNRLFGTKTAQSR